jgi:dihydrofolate synthase/folylpolyglutamate synthase
VNTASPSHADTAARAWLDSLAPRGIQLGLGRVHAALARLGDPHRGLRAVTIAGTNGKGSTAAFVEAIARAAGLRTALYTSPHLVTVHERFRVDGHPIPERDFCRWADRVREAISGPDPIPLTQFEALTVMAFGWFRERAVDLAVLEIGLGGRLDAVNAADPLVAVLTSVARDHEAILGPTLADIAREKVAIARPDRPLITGVSGPLWRRVVGPHAFEIRAHPRRLGVDFVHTCIEDDDGFRYRGWRHTVGPVRLSLLGTHQRSNAALACAAIEALIDTGAFPIRAHHIAEGLQRAVHRGRMERIPASIGADGRPWPHLLLDGAHNPAGARALAPQIAAVLPEGPKVLLFGVNPEKKVLTMLRALAPAVQAIVLTCPSARPGAELGRFGRRIAVAGRPVLVEPTPIAALEEARNLAVRRGASLVIAGSLYLLGDLIPWLPGPDGTAAVAMTAP